MKKKAGDYWPYLIKQGKAKHITADWPNYMDQEQEEEDQKEQKRLEMEREEEERLRGNNETIIGNSYQRFCR